MNFIKTFEELKALPNSSKVHQIKNGQINTFIVVGTIKQTAGIVLVDTISMKSQYLKFFYQRYFNANQWIEDNQYNTKEVGELMIQQIRTHAEEEVENITDVYLKDK